MAKMGQMFDGFSTHQVPVLWLHVMNVTNIDTGL